MKLKSKLTISGMITAVTCALVGSITGTFAWYGYSTRATTTIGGTTINAAANLQIGIHDEAYADSITGLEDADANGIFWQPKGGGLRYDAIAEYLAAKGYGSEEMRPVSSGNIYKEDGITRKDIAPVEMVTYQSNTKAAADEVDYFVLPLALRVEDASNTGSNEKSYLQDIEIFLSDIEVDLGEGNEDHYMKNSFRIDFKEYTSDPNDAEYKLLAPGKEEDGKTVLAGLLDLNQDGYADVKQNDYGYRERDELIYGDYKADTVEVGALKDEYDEIDPSYEFPVHLKVGEHYSEANVKPVTAFKAYEQDYVGSKSLLCDFNASNRKVNTNSVPAIATTPATEDGIVYLTLTAWIEGWDLVDEDDAEASSFNKDAMGHEFHLNLQFQIDRVD